MGHVRLAAFGLVGVGVGHLVEYLVLPGHGDRHTVLAYTGNNDYLATAAAAGVMLVLVASIATFLSAVRRGMAPGARSDGAASHSTLPVAQAVAFALLEVGERLLTQGHLPDLGLVLAVGLPLQLLVGWLVVRLITGIARSGERLGRSIAVARFRAPARPRTRRPASWSAPGWSLAVALEPTRGPPPFSLSS